MPEWGESQRCISYFGPGVTHTYLFLESKSAFEFPRSLLCNNSISCFMFYKFDLLKIEIRKIWICLSKGLEAYDFDCIGNKSKMFDSNLQLCFSIGLNSGWWNRASLTRSQIACTQSWYCSPIWQARDGDDGLEISNRHILSPSSLETIVSSLDQQPLFSNHGTKLELLHPRILPCNGQPTLAKMHQHCHPKVEIPQLRELYPEGCPKQSHQSPRHKTSQIQAGWQTQKTNKLRWGGITLVNTSGPCGMNAIHSEHCRAIHNPTLPQPSRTFQTEGSIENPLKAQKLSETWKLSKASGTF